MSRPETGAAPADTAADVMPAPDDDVEVAAGEDDAPARDAAADEAPQRPASIEDEGRDDIVARYRAQRDQDRKDAAAKENGEADEPAGDEPAPRQMSKPSAAAPVAAEGAEEGTGDPPQPLEITLIVDGKPVKKSLAEVTQLAQLTVASDNRLDEAKRLVNEMKALRAAPGTPTGEAPEDARPDPSAATSDPGHQRAPTLDRAKLAQFAERIQVGDAEEGAAALEELVTLVNSNRPQTEALTQEQVGQLFNQHFVQRETKQEIDSALAEFRTNFTAIAEDPDFVDVGLRRLTTELRAELKTAGLSDDDLAGIANNPAALAMAHRQARLNGHKVRPIGEVLTGIGDDMSAKYGLKPSPRPGSQPQQQQRAPAPSSAVQRRVEAKRNTPQQPRTAGVRVPQAQPPRPKTSLEKVNEARIARGFSPV